MAKADVEEGGTFTMKKDLVLALEPGTYTLKEVEAPKGYAKLAKDLVIVVSDKGELSFQDEKQTDAIVQTDQESKTPQPKLIVRNTKAKASINTTVAQGGKEADKDGLKVPANKLDGITDKVEFKGLDTDKAYTVEAELYKKAKGDKDFAPVKATFEAGNGHENATFAKDGEALKLTPSDKDGHFILSIKDFGEVKEGDAYAVVVTVKDGDTTVAKHNEEKNDSKELFVIGAPNATPSINTTVAQDGKEADKDGLKVPADQLDGITDKVEFHGLATDKAYTVTARLM